MVDYEYKHLSWERLCESQFWTARFCHGIIGVWRRDRFLEVG
jgi:hypothetical protein